jgi:hypothetical protein
MPRLQPEAQLIIGLSRISATQPELDAARDILAGQAGALDWALILDQAAQHRVAPLLSASLGQLLAREPALPTDPSVIVALRALYLYHAQRNALVMTELADVVAAAWDAGARAVVRKGGHLVQQLYPDPGLRPMGDVDILAGRQDAAVLAARLAGLGYRQGQDGDAALPGSPAAGLTPLSRRQEIFWRLHGSDLPKLSRPTGDPYLPWASVDISTSLTLPGKDVDVPTEELLERAVSTSIGGVPVWTLAPDDVVLDLCLNIYKNSTALRFMKRAKHRRLIKYVDLAEYLSQAAGTLSWDAILTRSRKYGAAAAMYYSLAHLEMLYGSVVPDGIVQELAAESRRDHAFLDEYGAWDLETPRTWSCGFSERFFNRRLDAEIPPSRSIV